MNERKAPRAVMTQLALASAVLVSTLMMAACGGGGSEAAGTPVIGNGQTGGGTGGTVASPKMSIALSANTVTAAAPATVSVTLKSPAGAPIPGQVVTFSTAGTLGALSPASALTDGNGVASVVLKPASPTAAGADTVKATATVDGKEVTASTGFQLTATDVAISSFTADVTGLSAYGQTTLTVNLSGTSASSPVNVSLSSACVTNGKGTLTPATVTTSTGRATFTFRDGGCGAVQRSDSLQASVTGSAATASLTLPVASPAVSSISFVEALPQAIYLRGSGYAENANVKFMVKDANGNCVPEQLVELSTTTQAGGLTLDGVSAVGSAPPTVVKRTDSKGEVLVRINSGTVPTPVRVKATLQGSSISTVSSALAIAVGLPSQLNFSLSQGTRNIEGLNVDGTANTYSILAADRLGNPVPDDTAINFVLMAGGQIQAIRQTALNNNGVATATANFVSSSPRPGDGRITVVAYALGEESFLDLNGNNVYDAGEPFQDLGDVYIDRNFNDFFNADRDQFIPLAVGTGSQACNPWGPEPGATLLATNVSIPSKPASCDQAWGKNYVRRAIQTVLSGSSPRPVWGTSLPGDLEVYGNCPTVSLTTFDANGQGYTRADPPVPNKQSYFVFGQHEVKVPGKQGSIYFIAADNNPEAFNPLPAGTVISTAATDGLTATVVGGSPVASSLNPTGVAINFKLDDKSTTGTISVTFRTPGGLATTIPLVINTGTPAGSRCN